MGNEINIYYNTFKLYCYFVVLNCELTIDYL